MRQFRCYICNKVYSEVALNEHHKRPRSDGGDDSPENLKNLDAGCHQVMEFIARMAMNPKKAGRAKDEIRNYLISVCPDFIDEACRRMEELVAFVVKYKKLKKERLIDSDPLDEKVLYIPMPEKYKNILTSIANSHKFKKRKMGVNRYSRMMLLNHIGQVKPELMPDIKQMLAEESLGR